MAQNKLEIQALSTPLFKKNADLLTFLENQLRGHLQEKQVLAITSKIVSLAEGRWVAPQVLSKRELIRQEADTFLTEGGYGTELTIKHGILIPSAGIDESNSGDGDFILLPQDPFKKAEQIARHLQKVFGIEKLGVLLTDSHSMPLRRGVTGVSLGHWGFRGVKSLIGHPDMFGKPLKFTHVNAVDALAAMAVFVMGEADDGSPLALISGAQVEFFEGTDKDVLVIPPTQDIYFPLFEKFLPSVAGKRDE